ncbi:MAG: winged helix-turn-helix transcriptional regulator [Solobacterium sp.]|nr:winged helix-turn-helix transcriptional regulator [Solobacterium sp.]
MDKSVEEFVDLKIRYPERITRFTNLFTPGGEAGVITWLCAQKTSVYATDIIARFGLTPGRVANIVKGLEARGYIERRTDSTDLRKMHISPTKAGMAYAEEVKKQMLEEGRELFGILGQEDGQRLLEILKRYIKQ